MRSTNLGPTCEPTPSTWRDGMGPLVTRSEEARAAHRTEDLEPLSADRDKDGGSGTPGKIETRISGFGVLCRASHKASGKGSETSKVDEKFTESSRFLKTIVLSN